VGRHAQVAARFHKYSFHNQLLIYTQRPDATYVAGYRAWRRLGRQVRKGEKGIAILAPCVYRTRVSDEDGEERELKALRGFRVAHVFDIAQTDGEPIEDLDAIRPRLLDGDAPEGIWDALVALAEEAGFAVVRDRRCNENGYCDLTRKVIGVRPDVTPAQGLKTLVHELAHALLHGDGAARSRELEEVEVESVAYVVCGALGLDTGDYSFAYVARWSNGVAEVVKDTAGRVVGCAQRILASLEAGASTEAGSRVES
jgi:DNA primase